MEIGRRPLIKSWISLCNEMSCNRRILFYEKLKLWRQRRRVVSYHLYHSCDDFQRFRQLYFSESLWLWQCFGFGQYTRKVCRFIHMAIAIARQLFCVLHSSIFVGKILHFGLETICHFGFEIVYHCVNRDIAKFRNGGGHGRSFMFTQIHYARMCSAIVFYVVVGRQCEMSKLI